MLSETTEPTLRGAADPGNRAIDVRNAALRTEIRLARGALGNQAALTRAVHDSVLYVLPLGEEALMCADLEGVTWVLAFTSVDEVARYAVVKGATSADEIDYLSVTGVRLIEDVLPRWDRPAGVALDIASTEPFLLPVLPTGASVGSLEEV